MRTETSREGSIPSVGLSVKGLLLRAVEGQPVRMRDLGMDVSADASVTEALAALAGIRSVENDLCVRSRFCQGDLVRQMSLRGVDKREFIEGVRAAHGETYYNALRRYAWVASKWPEDRRTDKKCWAWYVNNEPGRPGAPKRERLPVMVRCVATESVPAGELRTLEDSYGNKYTEVVAKEVQDAKP